MTVYSIELNDAGLLVGVPGKILLRSPGYALIHGADIDTGEKAFSRCRLHPQRAYNKFWSQLSLDPLTRASPRFRHNADLAHAHLMHIAEQLDEAAEVVFAVPGTYTNEQLSLLLGIAQETPLNVIGLVDMAVAAAATQALESRVLVLDIQSHQLVITELAVTDKINRKRVEVRKGIGLVPLHDRWIQLVADTFVEQCRFDPLHDAVTEQALYQQLPQWLAAICGHDEILLNIQSANAHYQAHLSRVQLETWALSSYQQIVASLARMAGGEGECQLLITDRLGRLPGIEALLPPFQRLAESAVLEGCGARLEQIRSHDGHLGFITALPCLAVNLPPETKAEQPQTSLPEPEKVATHLLQGADAYPLTQPLYLGVNPKNAGLMITRRPDQQHPLHCSLVREGSQLELRVTNGADVRVNGKIIEHSFGLTVGDEIILGASDARLTVIGEVGYDTPA